MSQTISIGNEIKDGYPETNKWVQNNIKWLSSLEAFYRERAKLEKEYSEKLSQLTKEYFSKKSSETVALSVGNTPATTPGSLESASQVAWNEILSQTEIIASDHNKFANDISFNICEQLKTLSSRCSALLVRVDGLNTSISNQKETSFSNLEKAKRRYYDACQTMESTRSKISKSSSEKGQRKLAEKEHEMNIAKNEYLIHISQANRIKDKYYFQDVPETLDLLQDLNETRIGMLNLIWQKAGSLERELHKTIDSRLDIADSVIIKNKPYLDTSMFIKHNVKTWKEPSDFLYAPSSVWHDDEHLVVKSQVELQDLKVKLAKAQQQLQTLNSQTESEKAQLSLLNTEKGNLKSKDPFNPMELQEVLRKYINSVSTFTSLENRKLEAEVEIETIQNNVGGEYDLDTENVDLSQTPKKGGFLGKFRRNLTLNSHQGVVNNTISDGASMISGETAKSKKSNKFSIFKKRNTYDQNDSVAYDDSVPITPSAIESPEISKDYYSQEPQDESNSAGAASKGTVLYNYERADTDEVTVEAGAVVTVLKQDSTSGWTTIKTSSGAEGLVPSTYIQVDQNNNTVRSNPPRAPPPRKGSQKAVTVLYDYQSQGDDELTLHVGEKITVIKGDEGTGWTLGEVNGRQGLFPTSYCK